MCNGSIRTRRGTHSAIYSRSDTTRKKPCAEKNISLSSQTLPEKKRTWKKNQSIRSTMERNISTKFIDVWLNSFFIAVIATLTASGKTHPRVTKGSTSQLDDRCQKAKEKYK